jgi:hypothetical protein
MPLPFEQHGAGLPRQCRGNKLEGAWALKQQATDNPRGPA